MLLKLLLRTFIFLHFPSFLENERSKFLFTEVEILPIPIELNMTITEECIHIHSNSLDQLNYHTISISSSQCIQDNEFKCLRPSLLYEKEYTNNNSSFCGLQNNSTYYLYFFNDQGHSLKETIYFTTVQTKPAPKFAQVESFGSLSLTLIIGITFWTLIIYLIILVIDRQKPKTSQKGKDRKIYEVFMYNENEENLQKKIDYFSNLINNNKRTDINMKELMALCKVLGSIVYEFEEQRICGLCCERPREVVFLDCGHIYTCAQCSKYLFKCPIDKKYIRSKYKYRLCDKHGINHSFLSQLSNTNLQTACTTSLNSRVETTMHEDEVLAQFSILKEEYYNYDYFTKCIKCNERTKNVIFEDCCHIVCCYKCSTTLQKCPLDSVEITKKSEVYFS